MREVASTATRAADRERRISHVFVMDVPDHAETLFITDAAINISPDLDAKRDIVQNAIDLFARSACGAPKVAILSAVETVTSKIPSTIDAAALCKMAERGQITRRHRSTGRSPSTMRSTRRRRASRASRRRSPAEAQILRRAQSRSRQHAGEEPDLPGAGRMRPAWCSARGCRSS